MEKIICVGRNYLKHAQELGGEIPEEPIFFLKPPSTMLGVDGPKNPLLLPTAFEVHHEVELVLRLEENDGEFYFSQYTFGLDLTLRDLQNKLKKAGQPWEKAKVFKNSSVVGPWIQLNSVEEALPIEFQISVNGAIRQKGQGLDMRWKPHDLLIDLQRWFPLRGGDLLFTGTPEGVGPLRPGDEVLVSGGEVTYGLQVN